VANARPPGEHACERPEPFLPQACPRPALSFAWRSQNCLFCTRNRTLGTPASEWAPKPLSRTPLSARSQHAKLLRFDPHILPKPHLVEVVLFQEFAEQICRKYLILQPLQAIPPNALCDDPVQRRGADFIRNGPQERNVPGFLADKAKSQAPIAISVIFALFEAFPNCILLLSPRLKIQFQPLPGCVAFYRLGNIIWTEK
jgi:hypothetical protein